MVKETILVIAYDINPTLGSEPGVAFSWVSILSKHYNVIVYTDYKHRKDLLGVNNNNITYRFIKLEDDFCKKLRKFKLYNVLSKLFVNKVYKDINKTIDINSFTAIHCLTPAGIFNYNKLYKFNIPVIVGPIGGGLPIPKGFKEYRNLKYFIRSIYYNLLKINPVWKNYFINSRKVIIGLESIKEIIPTNVNSTVIFDTVVDTDFFNIEKDSDNDEFIQIVYTGKLEVLKGAKLLLKAFEIVIKNTDKNVKLVYIGEGSEYENINNYVIRNNLEKSIEIIGGVSREKVKRILQSSDIFCLPTIRDNGCGAILEAMACGLPIVAMKYGGPEQSVTDECGIRIEPLNINQTINELSEALLKLIENRELRKNMGKKARDRVEKEFSYSALEKKILNVYNEVCNNSFNN